MSSLDLEIENMENENYPKVKSKKGSRLFTLSTAFVYNLNPLMHDKFVMRRNKQTSIGQILLFFYDIHGKHLFISKRC